MPEQQVCFYYTNSCTGSILVVEAGNTTESVKHIEMEDSRCMKMASRLELFSSQLEKENKEKPLSLLEVCQEGKRLALQGKGE